MIIPSLLDTDLYKFTMMQVVLHHFPGAQVEYRFKCRSEGVGPDAVRRRDPRRGRRAVSPALPPRRARLPPQLALLQERLRRSARPLPARRALHRDRAASPARDREIDISIKGPWLHTILFEVPVLVDRQRGLFPQHAAGRVARRRDGAGSRAKIGQINAVRRSRVPHRRLRDAAPLLAARGRKRW